MTTINLAHRNSWHSFGKSAFSIVNGFKSIWSEFKKRKHKRRAALHMNKLDDRLLKDIGLARYQIGDAVYGKIDNGPNFRAKHIHQAF
ncbi:MAG: DUF1127 domain-containing protein [Rhizobiaceae bacterium]|nr:DUF1127 domain-containing protein [Rhizobiaceae bacterium]